MILNRQGIIEDIWNFVIDVAQQIIDGTLVITQDLIDTLYVLVEQALSLGWDVAGTLIDALFCIIQYITGISEGIDCVHDIVGTVTTPAPTVSSTYPDTTDSTGTDTNTSPIDFTTNTEGPPTPTYPE